MKSTSPALWVLLWGLIIVPPVVYLLCVYKFAVNIPYVDDYDAILGFMTAYKRAGAGQRLVLLFSQHNEHRILSSRLVYVLYYALFGAINFRAIILINYFILVGICVFFVQFARRMMPDKWWIAAVVFSLCLFDLNNFENADFAMAGMQNYGVILLFLASLYCYSREGRNWLPVGTLLQALCIFSSGNGNLASLCIVLYAWGIKDRMKLITSVTVFLLIGSLYFIDYHKGIDLSSHDPMKMVVFFLHVLATHFSFKFGIYIGILVLTVSLWLLPWLRKSIPDRNVLPFICIFIFILGSLGTVSVFRSGLAPEAANSSRYCIYSNMATAILFLAILMKLESRHLQRSVLWAGLSVLTLFYIRNCRNGYRGFEFIYAEITGKTFAYPQEKVAARLQDEACREGIYCRPAAGK